MKNGFFRESPQTRNFPQHFRSRFPPNFLTKVGKSDDNFHNWDKAPLFFLSINLFSSPQKKEYLSLLRIFPVTFRKADFHLSSHFLVSGKQEKIIQKAFYCEYCLYKFYLSFYPFLSCCLCINSLIQIAHTVNCGISLEKNICLLYTSPSPRD